MEKRPPHELYVAVLLISVSACTCTWFIQASRGGSFPLSTHISYNKCGAKLKIDTSNCFPWVCTFNDMFMWISCPHSIYDTPILLLIWLEDASEYIRPVLQPLRCLVCYYIFQFARLRHRMLHHSNQRLCQQCNFWPRCLIWLYHILSV